MTVAESWTPASDLTVKTTPHSRYACKEQKIKLSVQSFEPSALWLMNLSQPLHKLNNNAAAEGDDTLEETLVVDAAYDDFEDPEFFKLDPLQWKEQDHYAILGLSRVRWNATEEEIKRAYRRKVLKHHPDKKADTTQAEDSNYFKCTQKAYELLSDPVKRRQFDSVDSAFDETIPTSKQCRFETPQDFFNRFGPILERNAHFSKDPNPAPKLGDMTTPRHEVEEFYDYWFSFDSWRSFEYQDEEPSDNAENREERRYLERKNKTERALKKKEDGERMRKLLELASTYDPRMALFKEEDKIARNAKKNAKGAEQRQQLLDEQLAREAEQLVLDKLEGVNKARCALEKAEKDSRKKLIKVERKAIRAFLAAGSVVEASDSKVEELFAHYADDIKPLELLSCALRASVASNSEASVFQCAYRRVLVETGKVKAEAGDEIPIFADVVVEAPKVAPVPPPPSALKERNWDGDELRLLIKAVNQFPGGTQNRWEAVATWLNAHSVHKEHPRTTNEIIKMAKEIQTNPVEKATSALTNSNSPSASPSTATTLPSEWTKTDDMLLNKAMKLFPSSGSKAYKGPDRWEKIAEKVPRRTKEEVMARVKELVQALKKK